MRMRVLPLVLLALAAPLPAAAGEKIVFAFDYRITSVDLMIGLERGYFAEQGLDVEVSIWNGTTETLPALAQGRVDVAPTGSFGPAYVNVIQRGAGIRLVAARAVHRAGECGYASFVARRELIDSGRLTDFASVRGLRINTDRSSSQHFYVDQLLELGGLSPRDVEFVNLPNPARADALAKGLIDLSIATEPSAYRIVQRGAGVIWRPLADVAPDQQNTFLMFGPRLLGERRDLGRKVMAGWLAAVRDYVREGKSPRNVALVARLTRMPEADVRQLCWPPWAADGRIDPASLDRFQRWAQATGYIDARVPFQGLVDEGFLDDLEHEPRPAEPAASQR